MEKTHKAASKVADFQKLAQGCYSLTFQCSSRDRIYVIKYPLGKGYFAYRKWFFHTQKEILFLNEYAPQQNQVTLPKIIEVSDSCIVQRKVSGIPLSDDLYQNLSSEDQYDVAQKLASFFVKLHNKNRKELPHFKKHRLVLKKYLKYLDNEEKNLYLKYSRLLKRTPFSIPFICLCITDLKANHILYNSATKQVGLIDFGSIHFDTPESEFILKNPIRSHLSPLMLKKIIEIYNRLQRSKLISWNRIKCYLVLYALKEIYCNHTDKAIPSDDKSRLKHILFDFVQKVEQA